MGELRPTDQPGCHMRWPGMEQPIQLRPDQVRDSPLCTTLDLGSSKVATVEHLLAALAGCGLSHVEIVLDGQEVPLLDGSALGWVEAIAAAGLVPAATPRPARTPAQAARRPGGGGSGVPVRVVDPYKRPMFPCFA